MAAYIKFDGVDGEAKDADHKKWMDCTTVSHSITREVGEGMTGHKRNRASANHGPIEVERMVDKSTPKLAAAISSGKVFPTVLIDIVQSIGDSKRVPYLQWELKKVIVTAYSISADADGGEPPKENLGLSYEEIKWIYTEFGSDGSKKGKVEEGWKLGAGEAA